MGTTLEVSRYSTAGAFLTRAESWLLDTEIENAVALASARHARADDSHYQHPIFWATVEDGPRIIGCAYRTPPYRVGVTELPAEAIEPLMKSLREFYTTLSGVSGPEATASALATAWCERYGGQWSVQARQRLRLLEALTLAADAPTGALRAAAAEDAGLAHAWGTALASESGTPLDGNFCVRLIRAGRLYFWDDGAPRSMVGMVRETPYSAALGIAYTPRDERKQGYATRAIAAWARRLLDQERRCYLYADPANAAMNTICARLGFKTVHDEVDIDFR